MAQMSIIHIKKFSKLRQNRLIEALVQRNHINMAKATVQSAVQSPEMTNDTKELERQALARRDLLPEDGTVAAEMPIPDRDCEIDQSGTYRYVLTERLDPFQPKRVLVWICLNPSTANKTVTDQTLRRIITITKNLGYTELRIVNLFAFRSPDPSVMLGAPDPIGPKNDYWIRATIKDADRVIAAWGVNDKVRIRNRAAQVIRLLGAVELYCLDRSRNQDGRPYHPRLAAPDTPLTLFKHLV
jgi:hypothetical protein